MKALKKALRLSLLVLMLAGVVRPAKGQDDVTIPKSRLEELERKEHELERLKAEKPREDNPALKQPAEGVPAKPVATAVTQPVPIPVGPAMDSLPPIKDGELVEAVDLANHYRQDSPAAVKRYNKRKITLHGEIVAFEKPMLR